MSGGTVGGVEVRRLRIAKRSLKSRRIALGTKSRMRTEAESVQNHPIDGNQEEEEMAGIETIVHT